MDLIKNLTGKDQKAYEAAASRILDTGDVNLFEELVSKDDFLFDFVKKNVANRLYNACNKLNFKNLFKFLNVYSPYYDDFIVSKLVEYSDESVEKHMLECLKNGSESEKTYAANYFSQIKNVDTREILRENAYSENTDLASNCAKALAKLGDIESYNDALEKLKSNDGFMQYSATKFLVNYQDNSALKYILETMKISPMAENIAAEIPFLYPLNLLINTELNDDALLTFCYIISGLSELIPISAIIDYNFYEILNTISKATPSGPIAVALFMSKEKFNLFIENEEYLFDEDNNTKNEVKDINIFLNSLDFSKYKSALYEELYEDSDFIYFALELINDEQVLVSLLDGNNQTVIMKSMSILKSLGKLSEKYKQIALNSLKDDCLKTIAKAM